MTLNTQFPPTFPFPPMLQPQQTRSARPDTELFGTLVLEVVMPSTDLELPALPNWELRVWPVARLGDVTLEARPLLPYLSSDDLRVALNTKGWIPLGPVRTRRE